MGSFRGRPRPRFQSMVRTRVAFWGADFEVNEAGLANASGLAIDLATGSIGFCGTGSFIPRLQTDQAFLCP